MTGNTEDKARSSRRQTLQVPARIYLHRIILMLAAGQADRTGQGDHRAVVGAEIQPRKVDLEAIFRTGRGQFAAQSSIGADTAGDNQPLRRTASRCISRGSISAPTTAR